jgi:hypothetical protein
VTDLRTMDILLCFPNTLISQIRSIVYDLFNLLPLFFIYHMIKYHLFSNINEIHLFKLIDKQLLL